MLAGCASQSKRAPEAANPPRDPPLSRTASSFAALDVPGFGPAVLFLPDPAEGAKPLLLVAHGAGGVPESDCEYWANALGTRAVILCLRGSAEFPHRQETGYYFKTHYALEREALAALDALARAHADAVAPGPAVYLGFSQGAIMGALFASAHPERFRRLVLIEGGYDEWNVASATRFAGAGGAKVLFACGVSHCARHARRELPWLLRGGVEARVEYAAHGGHDFGGEVGANVLAAWPWLVSGDARWETK